MHLLVVLRPQATSRDLPLLRGTHPHQVQILVTKLVVWSLYLIVARLPVEHSSLPSRRKTRPWILKYAGRQMWSQMSLGCEKGIEFQCIRGSDWFKAEMGA
jgi:hypothetical protein